MQPRWLPPRMRLLRSVCMQLHAFGPSSQQPLQCYGTKARAGERPLQSPLVPSERDGFASSGPCSQKWRAHVAHVERLLPDMDVPTIVGAILQVGGAQAVSPARARLACAVCPCLCSAALPVLTTQIKKTRHQHRIVMFMLITRLIAAG